MLMQGCFHRPILGIIPKNLPPHLLPTLRVMAKPGPLQCAMRTLALLASSPVSPKCDDLSIPRKQLCNELCHRSLIVFWEEMEYCTSVQKVDLSLEIVETGIGFIEDVCRTEFDPLCGSFVQFLAQVDEILEQINRNDTIGTICVAAIEKESADVSAHYHQILRSSGRAVTAAANVSIEPSTLARKFEDIIVIPMAAFPQRCETAAGDTSVMMNLN
jgi:hypothetical protein